MEYYFRFGTLLKQPAYWSKIQFALLPAENHAEHHNSIDISWNNFQWVCQDNRKVQLSHQNSLNVCRLETVRKMFLIEGILQYR